MSETGHLVVDLFPGWGFLSQPWSEAGFPVLWGPDLCFSETVEGWHLPEGLAWGIVSGIPCQLFSVARLPHADEPPALQHRNMTRQVERVISEARPIWYLTENVRQAPIPVVEGYKVQALLLDSADFGCAQSRVRRFTFGSRNGAQLGVPETTGRTEDPDPCLTAPRGGGFTRSAFERQRGRRLKISDLLRGVGLPEDTPTPWPLKKNDGWGQMLANAVPLSVGRVLRDAILKAMKGL